jgi:hypothetical protein
MLTVGRFRVLQVVSFGGHAHKIHDHAVVESCWCDSTDNSFYRSQATRSARKPQAGISAVSRRRSVPSSPGDRWALKRITILAILGHFGTNPEYKLSEARRFLQTEFSPERADEEFPNARRILEGGLFISHSGTDTKRIRNQLLGPVINQLVSGDRAFFHNRGSGGSAGYKRLVQAALHWCDKFLVVVSDAAVGNEWVIAEVDWAASHARPIVAVCFDGRRFDDLRVRAAPPFGSAEVYEIDLSAEIAGGQRRVRTVLSALLANSPVPRSDPT